MERTNTSPVATGMMPAAPAWEIDKVHRLWDALADCDTSRVDDTRTQLLNSLCELVGAQSAALLGLVRMDSSHPEDALKGWRLRLVHHLNPTPALKEAARIQRRLIEEGIYDATVVANLRGAGVFRANRLCDLVPQDWFQGVYYRDWYLALDRRDCIWVCAPVSAQVEVAYGIYRTCDHAPFSEAERDIVAYALRGLRWLHRQQMLNYGLQLAGDPLTDLEQRILELLLGGRTDKQIAAELQQSPYTTQEYVARLLRKYGVPNRTSLIALWLGKSY